MSSRAANSEQIKVTPRGMRIPDAAAYMGCTPWTVEVLVRSGKLRALKISRHYTILKDDCDAFLDGVAKASA
jgi:excisionase family DNA binding protein